MKVMQGMRERGTSQMTVNRGEEQKEGRQGGNYLEGAAWWGLEESGVESGLFQVSNV